jgi:hypothetical protein
VSGHSLLEPAIPGSAPSRRSRPTSSSVTAGREEQTSTRDAAAEFTGSEVCESCGPRIGDLEQRVQLRQLKQGAKIVIQAGKAECAAGLPDLLR